MAKSLVGQNIVKPSADSLAASAQAATKKGPAPVHLWNPPFCGDLDMEIKRDGTWFYMGTPIGRHALVKLFSSILKLEDGNYYLVTPVEKVGIRVEDAPFLATDVTATGSGPDQKLTFTTQVGDTVQAGADNPIRVPRNPQTGEPSPYVMVRAGLEALIDRKSFYRLVDMGETARHNDADWFGVWSGGEFFPIIPAADLPDM
ncbi:DUF1285 domain-containing protein [Meridianimarinicoccus aquatilis]|uniref:DUF1285 domain-containing protein n=1 Tax=Meridianimarinicoccus aquatilis TaxID=2552766 RepID=A0A4R6AWG8_9RHOB|nr:DUF1285 domain-containing protein [Fluviibacterium aquatile]QIE40746.1 DUF1285 domain-containing protein [Rhodobacteraceae bacterium SC52]TDL89061.1 DUF1285 domain-containing protein [Fluviibacterium aquatile]